jgi:hypothetical protein
MVKLGTTEMLILAITTSRFSSGAKYTASAITATFYKVNGAGDALEIDTSIGTSGVVTLSADTGSKTGFHTALQNVSAVTAKIYVVVYEATVDGVAAISIEFLDIDAERKKIADNLPVDISALALEETAQAIGSILVSSTYGLSALKDLLEAIDTSTELQARFTEIKGTNWTNETLKAIKDLVGSGPVTVALPAMQAGVSASYITQGAHVKIKRGDGYIYTAQIAGDWSAWTGHCGAKINEDDATYAVGPIASGAGVYDAATNTTLFSVPFTATHTATAYRKLYAEIELNKTGSDPYTPLEFFLTIKQDIVRD